MTTLVGIDGRVVSAVDATISVFDRGFLYGDSVFETVRTYEGRPYALGVHLKRLAASAALVHIELPVSLKKLEHEVTAVVTAAGNSESYVRIMVTRGEGTLGLSPSLAHGPHRVVIVSPLKVPPKEFYSRGISVIGFRTDRPGDATGAAGAKIGNYLVAVMAMHQAQKEQAQEALIVNALGRVTEGATSNVFWIMGGMLYTPPEDAGILAGITRRAVLQAAVALGVSVEYACPALVELRQAEEVFISSSIRELMPVTKIDGSVVAGGKPGELTGLLHQEFKQLVKREMAAL